MEVGKIIQILLPAVVSQVLLQIYTINLILERKDLSKKKLITLIICVLLFNNLAVASYLFIQTKKEHISNREAIIYFRRGIFSFITLSYQIIVLQIGYQFNEAINYNTIILLSLFLYLLISFIELAATYNKEFLSLGLGVLLFGIILLLEYNMLSSSLPIITLIGFVGIMNGIKDSSLIKSIIALIIGYSIFMFFKTYWLFTELTGDEVTIYIFSTLIVFTLTSVAFVALKKQVYQNQVQKELIKQLNEQAKTIEKMTAKEERQKLAADIHDHVGHTLTTSIIQLESLLKSVEDDEQRLKIEIANEQIKYGLNQIRVLVRSVDIDFEKPVHDNIVELLHQTEKSAGLIIHHDIEKEILLVPLQQKVIIQAIKEFLTNSIKHGSSTEVSILLSSNKNFVECTLSNNGEAVNTIKYGYGLTQMDRSVRSIGGIMNVSSSNELGFIIYIKIPKGDVNG